MDNVYIYIIYIYIISINIPIISISSWINQEAPLSGAVLHHLPLEETLLALNDLRRLLLPGGSSCLRWFNVIL